MRLAVHLPAIELNSSFNTTTLFLPHFNLLNLLQSCSQDDMNCVHLLDWLYLLSIGQMLVLGMYLIIGFIFSVKSFPAGLCSNDPPSILGTWCPFSLP